LVGLGLVVSVDGGIPLVSHAYAGNRHDSTQFSDVIGELVTRFGAIDPGGAGLTVASTPVRTQRTTWRSSILPHCISSVPCRQATTLT
jgi:hypothetical protein